MLTWQASHASLNMRDEDLEVGKAYVRSYNPTNSSPTNTQVFLKST